MVSGRVRPVVPSFFVPLAAYAAWTLVSVAGSPQPIDSLVDAKEILLFLVVPAVYGLARGPRGHRAGHRGPVGGAPQRR